MCRFWGLWNVRSGQDNGLFGPQNAYDRIGGPPELCSSAFHPTLTPVFTFGDRDRIWKLRPYLEIVSFLRDIGCPHMTPYIKHSFPAIHKLRQCV